MGSDLGGPPPGSYPPAPGGYGGTAAPPFQGGQWTRPPPGAGPARNQLLIVEYECLCLVRTQLNSVVLFWVPNLILD